MKRSRQDSPQVNAGSMADIAFLLLIFFLVTAMIPKDKGITRKLPPPCPPNEICDTEIHQRNILEIHVNSKNELFVENDVVSIEALKDITKAFLDNNGDGSCTYCNGEQLPSSADNPKEAVVSLKNDAKTSYDFYIAVQDELTKAYYDLRSVYAKAKFDKAPKELTKKELEEVKKAYPFILSEAETK